MYKKIIMMAIISSSTTFALDMQRNFYDGAEEIEAMNASMNRAIKEHRRAEDIAIKNDPLSPKLITLDDFKETKDSYILEQNIEDANQTKVDVKLNNRELTISTETTKIEKKEFGESKTISSSSHTLSIPENADEGKMNKSYSNGLLKITFPKRVLKRWH